MAVTASRLGSAPITIDWSHVIKKYEPDVELIHEAWSHLKRRFNPNDVGYYMAPISNDISQMNESLNLADHFLRQAQFTDCLFLGIGGSCLGPLSLLTCLQEKNQTRIRFHFIDNPDPQEWKSTLEKLKPHTTLVCSVTKSGTTFETMAQTLLALEWLGKDRWKTHLIAITDPQKGDLREFANQEQIPSLSIHPSIGGRFSIFSPVGLFPAALAGLSVPSFLMGAKQVHDFIEKSLPEKNPLFILANELINHYPGKFVHAFMPYSSRLKNFGAWFVQLWGESLGKDGKGFTPLAAVGATDQHSILQLLRDGPDDKITFFLTVDQVDDEVSIPKSPTTANRKIYPAFRILEGHSLQKLLLIEQQATSLVLTKHSRPHITIRLDRLDERSLGALYFSFCHLTAFTGTLWNINPFDQPGVEEGKIYIRQALTQESSVPPEVDNAVIRLRGE